MGCWVLCNCSRELEKCLFCCVHLFIIIIIRFSPGTFCIQRVFLTWVFSENISLTCLEVYFLGDAESCQVDNGDEPSFTVKMKILSLSLRKRNSLQW